jgi:hypothetical protein
MVTTTNSGWVADVVTMTCKNTTNNIIVLFEKIGKTLNGKIINISLELINEWRVEEKGGKNIRNTIAEAEEVFLETYYQKKKE